MTRLALGANCGGRGARGLSVAASAALVSREASAPRPSRSMSIASAIAPRPVCECLRNCRRVTARARCRFSSSSWSMESALGQYTVKIEQNVGDRGPGGECGGVHARGQGAEGFGGQSQGCVTVHIITRVLVLVEIGQAFHLLGPGGPTEAKLEGVADAVLEVGAPLAD